jgi:hypothetical protein
MRNPALRGLPCQGRLQASGNSIAPTYPRTYRGGAELGYNKNLSENWKNICLFEEKSGNRCQFNQLLIAYGGGYNKRGYPYRYFQNTPRCTAAVRWRQAGRARVGGRWAAVCRIGGGPHAPHRRTAPHRHTGGAAHRHTGAIPFPRAKAHETRPASLSHRRRAAYHIGTRHTGAQPRTGTRAQTPFPCQRA